VRRHAVLRPLVLSTATTEFFAYVFFAVYVLYFTRELRLSATAIGLVFATGGVGALIGAVLAAPLARRFGQGPAIVVAQLLFGVSGLVIPLAALFPTIALEMVIASEFAQWLFIMVVNVNAVSLRQALTPDRLRGRVNATFRFLVVGPQPLGSLLGGFLGGLIGLPGTLVVGEIGMLLAVLWLVASPLPGLRDAGDAPA
jgi:MFS family permease